MQEQPPVKASPAMPTIFHPKHPAYTVRPISPRELPWMLRRNIWTGVLGAVAMGFLVGGPFFIAYCRNMGMTDEMFGWLTMLSTLMVLGSILAGALEEYFGHRKYPFFILAMASRIVLAPMLLGLFLTVSPGTIIAMVVASTALSQLSSPLWVSWVWDYVPRENLGRFWARRNMWATLGRMAVALAGAAAVRSVPDEHETQILCGIFALLLVAGIVDLLFHVHIPEPPRAAAPSRSLAKIREAFRNAPLRNLMLAVTLWHFALMISGPFSLPYMMGTLGFQKSPDRLALATVLTVVVAGLSTMCSMWAAGRLCDKTDPRLVAVTCYFFWAVIPLFYFLAPPLAPVPIMVVSWTFTGMFPAAAGVAVTLLVERFSGADKTMPAALMTIMPLAVGATLGSVLGTLIVRYFGTRAAFGVSFAARSAVAFAIVLLLLYFPWRERRRRRPHPQTP
ncbi:MAG: MFS transporter [Candidatus Brocadiia bacterium]|nr:MFS transporter [Candidatus Brocadiia bacterium]